MTEKTQTEKYEELDLLDSVNIEYLSKKKRNRKIVFSAISFLVLALATIIIVMSCIKVNLKPSFIEGVTRYEITVNSSTPITYEKGDKGFKEFDNLFEETFSINYLTALFTGKLGGYEINSEDETKDYFYSDTSNNKGMSSTLKNYIGKNYVRVVFDKEKTVRYSNGEAYKSQFNTNTNLVFTELYFALNTTQDDESLTFYLGTNGYLSGTRITKIKVEANTYSLYEYATQD